MSIKTDQRTLPAVQRVGIGTSLSPAIRSLLSITAIEWRHPDSEVDVDSRRAATGCVERLASAAQCFHLLPKGTLHVALSSALLCWFVWNPSVESQTGQVAPWTMLLCLAMPWAFKKDPANSDGSLTDRQEESAEGSVARERSSDATADLNSMSKGEIRARLALLDFILDALPVAIFIKDTNRNYVVTSKAYMREVNATAEQLIGHHTNDFVPEALYDVSIESDEVVLKQGKHFKRTVVHKDDAGNDQYYEIEKVPLHEGDRIVGVLGITRNLTEQKTAENRIREQQAMLLHATRLSTLGEMVAGIAHEINQPLYSITNYARAVMNTISGGDTAPTSDIAPLIKQIMKAASRGGEVTRRLKTYLKQGNLERERLSCSDLIHESIELVSVEASQADVDICFDTSEEIDDLVVVDRVQIQQVLVNLLINAIEALHGHHVESPRIVVSRRLTSAGVKVVVRDNGPGIPDHMIDEVFVAFRTTKPEGIGLGLPISKTILDAHDSKLVCEICEGDGALFHFTLMRPQAQ